METRWGKRFGRYEVVAELGRGAMGIVYKARDPKIDRFVAIKTICLLGHVQEEQKAYRERFFQEAQAAGRLIHPGIVTIFDVGEDPETQDPYIVMEYVAGVPLNGMLEEGKPLPLETAMRLTQQIAEALDCAHAQGIVHRDIKPSNLMVTADGQAKIMDFGIAKLNLSHLTLPGQALGTPAYISPEQLNGDSVDGRADIFSLGVILYNMVTGFRPFQGNSVITVCFKVANREPLAPTLLDPHLPRELDAVIARAIAKNPVDRYQRGMELALDLGELLKNRPPAVRVKPQPATFNHPSPTAENAGGSDADIASARSFLSRAFTTRKIVILSACFTAIGLLAFYRPLQVNRTVNLSSSPAATLNSSSTLPGVPPSPPLTGATSASVSTKAASSNPSKSNSASTSLRRAALQGSILDLEVNHHFSEGKVSLWVDGILKYSHPLRAETKKRLLVFHHAQGSESGKLPIPAGQHRIRVRAQAQGDDYDQSKEVSATFPSGSRKTLLISFDGFHKDMRLTLK
jgi:serine/threonine protein kinase